MEKKELLKSKVQKLDELVAFFEKTEDFDLDEGLKKYEEALALVKSLQDEMKSFELKIKEIEAKYLPTEE